jgi:hypothetical protein
MTWSTAGISKPRAATSEATRTQWSFLRNLLRVVALMVSRVERSAMTQLAHHHIPVQILETLSLRKLGVQWVCRKLQQHQNRRDTPQAIDGIAEHYRASRIAMQKVVQVNVLVGCQTRDLGFAQVGCRQRSVANVQYMLFGLVEVDSFQQHLYRRRCNSRRYGSEI